MKSGKQEKDIVMESQSENKKSFQSFSITSPVLITTIEI